MCTRFRASAAFSAILCTVATAMAAAVGSAAEPATKPPPFSAVERAVTGYFKERGLLPNDLVTRQDVAPLLVQLRQKKLTTADTGRISGDLLTEGEFLVEQLRTPSGRKFMRQIAGLPNAYDKLDRLSRMPHGQQTIRDLIRGPGGEKLIEYMMTTPGGKALGRELSNSPQGAGFNAPTGRIYTTTMLLARLRQSHPADAKQAAPMKN